MIDQSGWDLPYAGIISLYSNNVVIFIVGPT